MNDPFYEEQYVRGQFRSTYTQLFEDFERLNIAARSSAAWKFDTPYGTQPREVFDLCLSDKAPRGILLYFHAGYWQSRDKRQFHFIAPTLTGAGYDVAFIGYPLCPDVSVRDIVNSIVEAPAVIMEQLPANRRHVPVIACGHSAGAHLAVELALASPDTRGSVVKIDGILAISGIYNLEPLVNTSLNANLRLSPEAASACSPSLRVTSNLPPAYFVAGGTETLEFHAQSQLMARAWHHQGNWSKYESVNDADHFTLLCDFRRPTSFLWSALAALSS